MSWDCGRCHAPPPPPHTTATAATHRHTPPPPPPHTATHHHHGHAHTPAHPRPPLPTTRYSIQKDNLKKLYRTFGHSYPELALVPITRSVLRDVVAKYTAFELVSKRHEVADDMLLTAREALEDAYLDLHDLELISIVWPTKIIEAITATAVAVQVSVVRGQDGEDEEGVVGNMVVEDADDADDADKRRTRDYISTHPLAQRI